MVELWIVNYEEARIVSYEEARVKLTNAQLNKLKSASKSKTGTILTKENLQDDELLHELFLTTKQKTNINAFTNNMSTDTKLSIAQLWIIWI